MIKIYAMFDKVQAHTFIHIINIFIQILHVYLIIYFYAISAKYVGL